MKYISMIAGLLAVCLLFAGCKNDKKTDDPSDQVVMDQNGVPVDPEPEELTFRCNGAVVTLPGNFTDFTKSPAGDGYTFLYADPMVGLSGIQHPKAETDPSITSLEIYAASQATFFGGETVQKDGLWTLTYEDLSQNEPQMFVCVFCETENDYWTIQSYCTTDMFETFEATMWGYVKSVTFN